MLDKVNSVARKIDTKVANLWLKVAQKVATSQKKSLNEFKTGINRFLKVLFL